MVVSCGGHSLFWRGDLLRKHIYYVHGLVKPTVLAFIAVDVCVNSFKFAVFLCFTRNLNGRKDCEKLGLATTCTSTSVV